MSIQARLTRRVPIDREWSLLEPVLSTLKRGDLLKYSDIERITGLEKDSYAWSKLYRRLRRHILTALGAELVAEKSVGWRIPSDSEQLHRQHRRMGLGQERIMRAGVLAALTDDAKLPEVDKPLKAALMTHAAAAERLLQEQKTERRILMGKPPEILPRPK